MHSCRLIYHLFMAKMKIFSVLKAVVAVSSGPEVIQFFLAQLRQLRLKFVNANKLLKFNIYKQDKLQALVI